MAPSPAPIDTCAGRIVRGSIAPPARMAVPIFRACTRIDAHIRPMPSPFPPSHGPDPRAPQVRPARPADAPAITAIYNAGIRGRRATFETRERTPADIEGWFAPPPGPVVHPPHPFLVAEQQGVVTGWVHASVYRSREAYRRIAEYSIYVADAAQGRGVGHALMTVFLPACEAAGITKLVARIFPDNRASLALCTRHGFRVVGTYAKHGTLDGAWRDVVIVERLFDANLD